MSRSQYSEDLDDDDLERYRRKVHRAIHSRGGQRFLRELGAAMDAMPKKALIAGELVNQSGECCAIGAVCLARGEDVTDVDYEEPESVAAAVGIPACLAAEIEYENDECGRPLESPEARWNRMRRWVTENGG